MPISQLLFSFRGRINRASYWLTTISVLIIGVVVVFVATFVALFAGGLDGAGGLVGAAAALLILYIPFLWAGLAIAAKRLHDRDKSAWWLLLFYVLPGVLQGISNQAGGAGLVFYVASGVIAIWVLVELGFLRGTVGPNRYGPDTVRTSLTFPA
jgi:uncharacterized membrane protein YhaH (DUF805 family)